MSEIETYQDTTEYADTEISLAARKAAKGRKKSGKLSRPVSFHEFKQATSVLSHGCLKEIKNFVKCSDFVLSDDDDMDEPPQPTSDGGEVYMGDTGEVEEKEKAQKTTADDELEIKSMKTAAIVISRGCQQELKKLVSCSEFAMADEDEDDMEEQGQQEEGEKTTENQQRDTNLLSPTGHRHVTQEGSSSGVETEIEHIHISKESKDSSSQNKEKPVTTDSPIDHPITVKVELHCSENEEAGKSVEPQVAEKESGATKDEEEKREGESERRKSKESSDSEANKPVMIYEPKRGSYKARKSISLNDFKSSTVVISNAGKKQRSKATRREVEVLEDQNEDEDDDEIQGPVLREDENYYAECMSLAQSSSCVTLADQDGQEIVYEQGTTTHYETVSPYEDTSYMSTQPKEKKRDKSEEKRRSKSRQHEDEYVVRSKGTRGDHRSKARHASDHDRSHSRAESEGHSKKKEVSIYHMLNLVSGMLSEVTDSLERLNKCSEKSASMNNSPIQSPVPMRRKYRLLQNNDFINSKYKQVRACNSLPRNFYPGCHFRSQISDISNLESDGISSAYDNLPEPVAHESHVKNDKLRVVLLKRKMYERYPQYFPDTPSSNWYDTDVNIVSYDTHQEKTSNAHPRGFKEPCSNYYLEGIEVGRKKSLHKEYSIGSNYYETVD